MKSLFKQRTFLPFFITQFLGAFNDNVFKNALILVITFNSVASTTGATNAGGLSTGMLVNIASLLFILPFFLFSSLAGQIGDKYEKSAIIRKIKFCEMVIMSLAAVFFLLDSIAGLLFTLFLMGAQSAMFGPVKYSIMPQHIKKSQLLKGNAYVETGTFLAILMGTIYAGLTINIDETGKQIVSASILFIAVAGYLASRYIPVAKASSPTLAINLNPLTQTYKMLKQTSEQPLAVSRSILGISWFWFLGSVYLTQLPVYAKDFLHGDETVVTLLLTIFSVGIGLGSILCEKLSDDDVELGLVPLGALGLTVFGIMLYFATQSYMSALSVDLMVNGSDSLSVGKLSYQAVLDAPHSYSILASMLLIGISGGIYTVPLYTLIQLRTDEKKRSTIIASNNVWNALFMVVAAIYAMIMLNFINVVELMLSVVILNVLVSVYIFTIVPEFVMRFMVWLLLKLMYRIKTEDMNVPKEGRLLIVSNHVSFVDALIVAATIRRPMRFVMYYKIYNAPVMNFIFRNVGAIPIAGIREDKAIFTQAFDDIATALENDEVVYIFPEGSLTKTGEITTFKSGIEHIIKRTPAPVYPIGLQGLWGSYFSRSKERGFFKRFYSKVTVKGGELIAPEDANRETLQKAVADLRGDKR